MEVGIDGTLVDETNYNLIEQRVDREDYRIGWKEKDNG